MLTNKYDSAIIKLLIPKSSAQISIIESAFNNGLDWKKLGVNDEDLNNLKLKPTKLPQSKILSRSTLLCKKLPNY